MSFERFSNVTEHWRVFAHFFCSLTFLIVREGFNIFRYGYRRIFISQSGKVWIRISGRTAPTHDPRQAKSMGGFSIDFVKLDSGPRPEDCRMSLGQTQAWLHRINSRRIQCRYRRWNSLTWSETGSLRLSPENNDIWDQWPYIQERCK